MVRPGPPGAAATPRIDFYVDMSVDLHGMRPSDALLRVDRHLSRCHDAGLTVAHIVHGRGTGALRDAVRRHLTGHPLVASFRDGTYGMGGDGVTVVELRPARHYRP